MRELAEVKVKDLTEDDLSQLFGEYLLYSYAKCEYQKGEKLIGLSYKNVLAKHNEVIKQFLKVVIPSENNSGSN